MKAILFAQEDLAGFEAAQEKIHNYLVSQVGVNGFKYSASRWSAPEAPIHEDQLVLEIDEREPRYSLILEALDQDEIDAIVEIEISDNV